MNVIPRGGSYPVGLLIDQNADLVTEKFGSRFVNINKKKVLNNWIKEEIVERLESKVSLMPLSFLTPLH